MSLDINECTQKDPQTTLFIIADCADVMLRDYTLPRTDVIG